MDSIFIKRTGKAAPTLKQESTGIPSLDALLAGGYLQGTLVLIEEEVLGNDALQVARCFLGAGAANNAALLVYSHQEGLVPVPAKKKAKAAGLRIAWRYEQYSALAESDFCFDLSKSAPGHPSRPPACSFQEFFQQLLADIAAVEPGKVTRVFIDDLLGHNWVRSEELFPFLLSLRNVARSTATVILMTAPTQVLELPEVTCLHAASDLVLSCESFADTHEEFGEFTGIFRIKKVQSFHSLQNTDYHLLTLGIKRGAKTISIEALSLPPDETIVQPKLEY